MRGGKASIALACLAAAAAQAPGGRLTGDVTDILGSHVVGARAELSPMVGGSGRRFETKTDSTGRYEFQGVPAGEYLLTLQSSGFQTLRVKPVQVTADGIRVMPALVLDIGAMADCGGHGYVEFVSLLDQPQTQAGRLRGVVRARGGLPLAGAEVTLLCEGKKRCGKATTNTDGAFEFEMTATEGLSVQIQHRGFYTEKLAGLRIRKGLASVYAPVSLERCQSGSGCGPDRRRRVVAVCE